MANGYTEQQVRIASVVSELERIRETATDLFNYVDLADATTFDKEDGSATSGATYNYSMAFSQALQRPSATSCAYINEMQLRILRARSRAFAALNPYWMAVRENRVSYVVGTGHVVSVVPRRKGKKVSDDLRYDILDELEQFQKLNQYRRRQGEKLTRLDRDGEFFLRFHEDRPDGILRVRFVEPLLVQDPPGIGPAQNCWFGIQFSDRDYEEPIRYYVRPATYDGGMTAEMDAEWRAGVEAADMQHRTANVDIGSPRGLPNSYSLQEPLTQAVSTLKSMGKLVDVRARIALIRKQVNATLGQIQPLLLRNRAGSASNAVGQLRNVFGMPYGTVLDTNDQRTFEFPTQNIETDKIVHSLKADLQAVAAAMGLADFTISGDTSQAFSNALVKEGPMDRAIGRAQQDMIQEDIEVYERAINLAISHGRLPADALEIARLEVMPPGVIARERLQNTQADELLVRNGAMSTDTMAMRANLDPDDEREKLKANPPPMMLGNGDTRSNQPSLGSQPSGRGVPRGAEPGPSINTRREGEE